MVRATTLVFLLLAGLLASSSVWAIAPAIARQYQPLPVDTNVFFLGYIHANSNTGLDDSIPIIESADIDTNAVEAVYMHYFDLDGKTSYAWFSLPWANVSANAASPFPPFALARTTSGVGQPVFGFNYGYKGAPAMTPREFICWQQTSTYNAAIYVSPPLGSYSQDRLLNIGTNRWEIKPELTAAYRHGKWLGELYGNVVFFSDNSEFLGNNTLKQNPIYGLDAHLSYDFRPGLWASFDVFQRWGGKTFVNDFTRNINQNYTTLGFTLSGNVTPTDVLYLMYDKSISGEENPDVSAVTLLYGHLW